MNRDIIIQDEQIVREHLARHNPPIPVKFLPACLEALQALREGDLDRLIEGPEPGDPGVAYMIVGLLNLDSLL